jgi:hypothetical protein
MHLVVGNTEQALYPFFAANYADRFVAPSRRPIMATCSVG